MLRGISRKECIKVGGKDYDHRTCPANIVHETSCSSENFLGNISADMRVLSTIFICFVALVGLLCGSSDASSEMAPSIHRRFRNRLPSRGYPGEDFIVEDEDSMELNKRQLFDDYGHMRFGKRDRFDDYGHMRFGRNHD